MKIVNMQLDAADPTFIYSHLEDLPFLASKIQNGFSGVLNTYWSSSVSWTSFWTAQPPSVHGVRGFWRRSKAFRIHRFLDTAVNDYERLLVGRSLLQRGVTRLIYRLRLPLKPVVGLTGAMAQRQPGALNNRTNVRTPLAYQVMEKHGLRIGLVNCIYTYPTWDIHGYLISDWTMPAGTTDYCRPPEVKAMLEALGYMSAMDTFKGYYGFLEGHMSEDVDLIYECALELLEKTKEATVQLMNRYDWDFHATLFRFLDTVQHIYIDDEAKLLEAYQRIDRALADIAARVRVINDDICWLINSDHSMRLQFPGKTLKGGHDTSGFYCFAHDELFWKGQTRTLRIEDLMPTVLHLFGIRMPGVYGQVAEDLLRPTQEVPDTQVEDRLRALGYLD